MVSNCGKQFKIFDCVGLTCMIWLLDYCNLLHIYFHHNYYLDCI